MILPIGKTTLIGLEHEFYCIPETNKYQRQYWEARKKYPEALIHDDVMRYMNDTLIWIPSRMKNKISRKE